MTDKQQLFVNAYLGHANLNATEAARIAGYRFPNVQGSQLKKEPDIAAAIASRLKEQTLAADEVLRILSDQARGTLMHFIGQTVDGDAFIDLTSDAAKDHFHLLKKAKTKKRSGGKPDDRWEETEIEIELHDPQSATVHMGRHYAQFTDRTDGSLNVGGVIGYDITPPARERPGDDHSPEES